MSMRQFQNPVLAYLTPWNAKGYDLAKKFHSKLTHVSPVWYDLKSQGSILVLEGRHNADSEWISELSVKSVKILPRVVLEANPKDYLMTRKQRNKAVELIVRECQEMDYDGIVLESRSRWTTYGVLHDKKRRKMVLCLPLVYLLFSFGSYISKRHISELENGYLTNPFMSLNSLETVSTCTFLNPWHL